MRPCSSKLPTSDIALKQGNKNRWKCDKQYKQTQDLLIQMLSTEKYKGHINILLFLFYYSSKHETTVFETQTRDIRIPT